MIHRSRTDSYPLYFLFHPRFATLCIYQLDQTRFTYICISLPYHDKYPRHFPTWRNPFQLSLCSPLYIWKFHRIFCNIYPLGRIFYEFFSITKCDLFSHRGHYRCKLHHNAFPTSFRIRTTIKYIQKLEPITSEISSPRLKMKRKKYLLKQKKNSELLSKSRNYFTFINF